MNPNLLLIQNDEADTSCLFRLCTSLGWNVAEVIDAKTAQDVLELGFEPCAVLCTSNLEDKHLGDFLHELHEKLPSALIIVTGNPSANVAWGGMFLSRPYTEDKLRELLGIPG